MSDTKIRRQGFSKEELVLIDVKKIPKHIAIIMDGNRRWARKRGKPIEVGHWQGAEVLDEVVRAAISLGVKFLTVYSFSTENWKRSQEEIDALMCLLEIYLRNQQEMMVKEGVRFQTIGNLSRLPKSVQASLDVTKQATEKGKEMDLILALNYGGRDDICRAIVELIKQAESGTIRKENIAEQTVSKLLDTAEWPDPDILIRPGGDKRISNFLIWQIAYSEIYYTDVLWPDFSKSDLLKAVIDFQKRKRRFGS